MSLTSKEVEALNKAIQQHLLNTIHK